MAPRLAAEFILRWRKVFIEELHLPEWTEKEDAAVSADGFRSLNAAGRPRDTDLKSYAGSRRQTWQYRTPLAHLRAAMSGTRERA